MPVPFAKVDDVQDSVMRLNFARPHPMDTFGDFDDMMSETRSGEGIRCPIGPTGPTPYSRNVFLFKQEHFGHGNDLAHVLLMPLTLIFAFDDLAHVQQWQLRSATKVIPIEDMLEEFGLIDHRAHKWGWRVGLQPNF